MKVSAISSVVIGFGLLSSAAFGATINVTASSTGCFYSQAVLCSPGATSQVGGLTFTGGSFSGDNTFSALLGTFELADSEYVYDDTYFGLYVMFAVPGGLLPAEYNAVLAGKVNAQGHGDVRIRFDAPTTISQNFITPDGPATLSLELGRTVYNVNSANRGPNASIYGDVSTALSGSPNVSTSQAPEPGTWMLFAGGGSFMVFGRFWKRRYTA